MYNNIRCVQIIIFSILLFTPAISSYAYTDRYYYRGETLLSSKIIIVDISGNGDFNKIQEGVDYAKNGDTIFIKPGEYNEEIVVNKSITLEGKSISSMINGPIDGTAIHIEADYVNITNLRLNKGNYGIYISNCAYINLTGLRIANTTIGGIFSEDTTHDIKINNCEICEYIGYGIRLYRISNVSVIKNKLYLNSLPSEPTFGIDIFSSRLMVAYNHLEKVGITSGESNGEKADVSNNIVMNSSYGISSGGSLKENALRVTHDNYIENCSTGMIVASTGNWIYRDNVIKNSSSMGVRLKPLNGNFKNNKITGSFYGGVVGFSDPKKIVLKVENNTFTNNINGILIRTSGVRIFNNNISYNGEKGIEIYNTDGPNSIINNTISHNYIGVEARMTSGNTIVNNWFIDNMMNARTDGDDNWNLDYPYGGNYWSDYVGTDVKKGSQQSIDGSDGFGDSSYIINQTNQRDYYPLFKDLYPPIANAGEDATIDLGDSYHFDASASTDDQLVHRAVWEWDYGEEHERIDLMEFDFKFELPGVFKVNLTAFDFYGNHDMDSINITVIDDEKPVSISQGNITIYQGEFAYLNGSASTDNHMVINYTWIIIEIDILYAELYGPKVKVLFEEPGLYQSGLRVRDPSGNLGNVEMFYIDVIDTLDPVADAGKDILIDNGEEAIFDGWTGSYDNYRVGLKFNWSFEYDGRTIYLNGLAPRFIFDIPGYYNVTLTLTDYYGNVDTDIVQVTVNDTISPDAVIDGELILNEGESLSLHALNSIDNGRISSYEWTFVDTGPNFVIGPYLNHTFEKKGYHLIMLVIRDDWSNWDMEKVLVHVIDNNPPIANAGEDQTGSIGDIQTFDGSASTDDGTIIRWEWYYSYNGEEMLLEGEVVHFIFNISGSYQILLIVYDQDENFDEDISKIIISDNIHDDDILKDDDTEIIPSTNLILSILIVFITLLIIIAIIWFLFYKIQPPEEE